MKDEISKILIKQFEIYPKSQIIDFLKVIYQNEFGCGHLIDDSVNSLNRIKDELTSAAEIKSDIIEFIGNGLCRVHLQILREKSLSAETFNKIFVLSALRLRGNKESFIEKVHIFEELCSEKILPFCADELRKIISKWEADGEYAFRHSEVFRENYSPAYRVAEKQFCDFIEFLALIDEACKEKEHIIVAIDGDCAAGKTTLAAMLNLIYECNVIHMDHFFLQEAQRTKKRLETPGGNIDFERFSTEVLIPLTQMKEFSYRPLDCRDFSFGEPIKIPLKKINIVEGAYSLHPNLSNKYDLKIFLSVDSKEQMRRISARNGEMMADKFKNIWIPMEKKYFSEFKISEICDLCFTSFFEY